MDTTETANNGKATRNNNPKVSTDSTEMQARKHNIPELGEATSGEAIGRDEVARRWSTKPTTWKTLIKKGTGKLFSRTADGKFVYIQCSKSLARSLDGLDDLRVPPDQQGMQVYQVWLNTF